MIETGKCEVCGAHIPAKFVNPLDPTCDVICRRAKRAGLTRGQEIEAEMIQEERYYRERLSVEAKTFKLALAERADRDYNRPYLWEEESRVSYCAC